MNEIPLQNWCCAIRIARAAAMAALAGVSSAVADPAGDAAEILGQSGIKGGIVVHLGCGSGDLTAALRAGDAYSVQGLDTDAAKVAAARRQLSAKGIYGPVSVDRWDGRRLPYEDNFVNLIVADDAGQAGDAEMVRALAPLGVALIRKEGQWRRISKPWPKEIDEWTHYLHGPEGNPVADDARVGPPSRLQWVGGPAWSRHHDHMASMTSLVSAQGRLFYIFDEGPTASIQLPSRWRLIARDAFNGTILWKRDIAEWNTSQYPLKSGPAHLLRRLVAVGDRVFVTLGIDAPVSALDAATGATVATWKGTEFTREIVVVEGTALLVADSSRSTLPDWRRLDTYTWDNTKRANPGWGWKGEARRVLAIDTASGRQLWNRDAPVAPCGLAADTTRVVFHDGAKLVCLDRRTGGILWEGTAAALKLPVETSTGPRVLIHEDVVLLAPNDGKVSGWAAADGRKLWEQKQKPSGHMSLKDLFVVEGLAWTGAIGSPEQDGVFSGYDPRTGEVKKEFPPDVDVHWFHHRCYPSKAAGKYLITARNGTEYVDVDAKHWTPNHWVRGGCIYGVMPCNGLTYASMNACGCQLEAKLTGFSALASGPVPQADSASLAGDARLEKGPAYADAPAPGAPGGEAPADWPTYRRDAARSGSTSAAVPPSLGEGWQARIGGRLSALTIAEGRLYVASIDTHTLHALDATTGKPAWTFTAGGRIDSPPTCHQGRVLFGSADGYLYALRASDGALAWRFRGAPEDRRIMAWEQIESAWPVHGSVLVHDNVLYATAGRNMFVDGGIRFLRLDPGTGRLLGEVVMDNKDPVSGKDIHEAYLKKTPGNNMPVAHSDILSCNGRHIWMRSQKIDFDGKRLEMDVRPTTEQAPEDFHLFCQNGFLDDSYFFRSFWSYGRRVGGGYGDWFKAERYVPSGRILCFDSERVYGFGRRPEYAANASVQEYHIFASEKTVTAEAIERLQKAQQEMNARLDKKSADSSDWRLRHFFPIEKLSAATYRWAVGHPAMLARAMAAAGDTLFVAGPPQFVSERQAFHQPDDAEVKALVARQAEALDGRHGGQLWAMAKSDGKVLARYEFNTVPVFDGIAAARGNLYMATVDGRVMCLSGSGGAPLPSADTRPIKVAWSQPEDAGYLKPPPQSKAGEFATVSRCTVESSDLGYRVRGEPKTTGFALKRLDNPITGAVTFRARMKSVEQAKGLLRNGHIAFGNGDDDASLVKCGVGYATRKATILQGPLKVAKGEGAEIQAPGEKGVELVVAVDLKAGTVRFTANGATTEARLKKPLDSIDRVGYAVSGALMDFTPIAVEQP